MTSFTLPTPTVTTPRTYYDNGKSRQVYYEISRVEIPGGYTSEGVQVQINHNRDRKQFYATAYPVKITDKGDGFVSTLIENVIMDSVRLLSEPVARFSQKGLDAFTAKVVEQVPEMIDYSAKFGGMFLDYYLISGQIDPDLKEEETS